MSIDSENQPAAVRTNTQTRSDQLICGISKIQKQLDLIRAEPKQVATDTGHTALESRLVAVRLAYQNALVEHLENDLHALVPVPASLPLPAGLRHPDIVTSNSVEPPPIVTLPGIEETQGKAIESNLLEISNTFGYTVFGTKSGFGYIETADLRDALSKNQRGKVSCKRLYDVDGVVKQIRLSADHDTIIIGIDSGKILLYKSSSLSAGRNKYIEWQCPFKGDFAILPNPETYPDICAIRTSSGLLYLLNISSGEFTHIQALMGVTSMCWSRKGKQLAVGDSTGSLRQIDLEGNVKNIIPMPSELTSKNLMVQHILWLEDMKFILRYSLEDNKSFQTFLVTQSGTLKSGRSTNYKALPPCSISLWKNTSDQRDGRQCPRVWAAANFAGTGIEFFCEVNGEWCVFNACCGTNLPLDQSDSVASLALDFSEEQPNSNHQSPRIFILSKSCSMFYFSLRDIVCRQVPFTVEVNAANPADQKGTESSYKATECTYADPSLARNESRSAPVVSTPTVIFGQTSGFGTVMSPKRGFPSVTSNSAFEQAYINKLGFFTASNNGTEGISVFGGSTQQLCFKGAPFSSYRESGSSER